VLAGAAAFLLAALALCAQPSDQALAAGGAYIRVNQVGYPTTAPKRAYLLSPRVESGAAFSVVQVPGGATMFTGTIGGSLGSWSRRYGHVYALDFDAVQSPARMCSRWRVALPRPHRPLRSSPGLCSTNRRSRTAVVYENERDGPEFIPSTLRSAPAHLNDESALTYLTPAVNAEGEFEGN